MAKGSMFFGMLILICGLLSTATELEAKAQTTMPAPVACQNGGCWKPSLVTRWNPVLSQSPNLSIVADMYDIDMFDTPASKVTSIHNLGRKAVCYFSAGSSENWRPDYGSFPKSVLGKPMDGWAGENWLDIRNIDALAPIMRARLDLCKKKGFDGVDFDNVDGYTNDTGFPLTSADQLRYNAFLANEAHKRGLTAALKNDLNQIPILVNYFDYAVNEQCFYYKECSLLKPFIDAGKPVFNIEYSGSNTTIFQQANKLNFNTDKKRMDLGNWVVFSR